MKLQTFEEREEKKHDEYLYRCEAVVKTSFGNYTSYRIEFKKVFIIKETPKGYWVVFDYYKKKWFSKTAYSRYAYPTKKEALFNFKRRKEKQIKILESRLIGAKTMLFEAERFKDEDL